MARIPTVSELTQRLNNLKTRESALKARQQANVGQNVGTGQPRPTESVRYFSAFTGRTYTVQAGKAAIAFFGGLGPLGLGPPTGDDGLPKGFHPAQIRASKGKAEGTAVTADLSQRKYLRYSVEAGADTQGTFTAPIAGSTIIEIRNKFEAIATAKKDDIGEYGRIDFIPERPVFSIGGT